MAPRILFVSDDVFFWARVHAAAQSGGCEAVRIGDEAAMEAAFASAGVSRVIVDLGSRAVDIPAWCARWKSASPPPQLVAFGSHANEAAMDAAREAGFDVVMANSRFNRTLSEWLSQSPDA
jgi:DNA-binding response OmpR family regulator